DPDLADVVVSQLANADASDTGRLVQHLMTLDRAALAPRLDRIIDARLKPGIAPLTPLLRKLAPLPMPAALRLVASNRLAGFAVAPFGDEQAPAVTLALEALDPEAVVAD